MSKSKTPQNQGDEKADNGAEPQPGSESTVTVIVAPDNDDAGKLPLDVGAKNVELDAGEKKTDNSGNESADESASNEEREEGGEHVEPPVKRGRGRPRKDPAAVDEKAKQTARLRSVGQGSAKRAAKDAIAAEPLAVINYQAMGEMVAGMWFNIGVMALGQEWAPDTASGEHLAVAGGFRDYLKAIQAKDLPPGFALVAILTLYTMKRVNKPTIKGRLVSAGLWLKDNLRIFGKRKGY